MFLITKRLEPAHPLHLLYFWLFCVFPLILLHLKVKMAFRNTFAKLIAIDCPLFTVVENLDKLLHSLLQCLVLVNDRAWSISIILPIYFQSMNKVETHEQSFETLVEAWRSLFHFFTFLFCPHKVHIIFSFLLLGPFLQKWRFENMVIVFTAFFVFAWSIFCSYSYLLD